MSDYKLDRPYYDNDRLWPRNSILSFEDGQAPSSAIKLEPEEEPPQSTPEPVEPQTTMSAMSEALNPTPDPDADTLSGMLKSAKKK